VIYSTTSYFWNT